MNTYWPGLPPSPANGVWLRRPEPSDVEDVWRIHSDPLTYAHDPQGVMRNLDEAGALLVAWRRHWEEHGFGYAALERRPTESDSERAVRAPRTVIGFAGLKWQTVVDRPVLNLYYRLEPESWGHGIATAVARQLVDWSRVAWPGVPVLARVALANPASRRVAEGAGLVAREQVDPGDPVPHLLLSTLDLGISRQSF